MRAPSSRAVAVVVARALSLPLALSSAVVLALVLAASSACGGAAATATPTALIPAATAAQLPPIEVHLLSGEPWASTSAAGRVLVVDVWATYCGPCKKAFPKLGRLAAAHPDAVVVGLSVDETDEAVREFLAQVPAAFTIARDPALTIQAGPLAVQKLPTLLVVDRGGRLRLRVDKPSDADYDALPDVVAALLSE